MSVKRNLLFSSVSVFLQVYSGSIVLIFLAKILNIDNFGELAFGIALSSIIATCGEFGYSLMTSRDIPQNRFVLREYVSNVLIQKNVINFIVFLLGFAYLFLFFSSGDFFWVKVLFLFDGIIISYSAYLIALLQALGRFKSETHSAILNAVLLTGLVVLMVFYKISFGALCLTFVCIHILKLFWLFYCARDIIKVGLPTFSKEIQKYLMKNSWSFGLHYIIGIFYFTVDTQIIFKFLGNSQLAIYSAAFRVITAILLFSNIIVQVFLPYLSAKYKDRDKSFNDLIKQLLYVITISTFFIGIIIIIFDQQVINFLYKSEYMAASELFTPILLMCLLRGAGVMYGILLTISDHQVYRVKAILTSLVISVISNLMLIKDFGIYGAACASLITHTFLLLIYVYYTKKIYQNTFIDAKAIIVFLTCIISILFVSFFTENVWLSITIVGVVTSFFVFSLKTDIKLFIEVLQKGK